MDVVDGAKSMSLKDRGWSEDCRSPRAASDLAQGPSVWIQPNSVGMSKAGRGPDRGGADDLLKRCVFVSTAVPKPGEHVGVSGVQSRPDMER